MIAVIGTQSTNEMIKTTLGTNRKNYKLEYFNYSTPAEIEDIVNSHSEIKAILFSGIIGLKTYEDLFPSSRLPYSMISLDFVSIILNILDIVILYKHIDISRIYVDFMDLIKQYSPENYNLLPTAFTENVQYFKFNHISEFNSENIYKDIERRYNNNQIDIVINMAAKIDEKLKKLGVEYKSDIFVMEDNILISFNKLVEEYERNMHIKDKVFTGMIHSYDEHSIETIKDLLSEYKIDNQIITFKIDSSEIFMKDIEANYKLLSEINNNRRLDYNIGIGIGRNEIESISNAKSALNYASSFGKKKSFLVTDEKHIIGPLNDDFSLKLNEYELNSMYEKSREYGVKNFNLCRLINLIKHKTIIDTYDVMNYLNIAHRSSNRILNTLEEKGVIEESNSKRYKTVGRPIKKYRLIT